MTVVCVLLRELSNHSRPKRWLIEVRSMRHRLKLVDLERLHILNLVIKHGSMSRAAELLNIQQPQVSEEMQLLEDEYGVVLFEKAHRDGSTPTEGGKALSAYGLKARREAVQLDRTLEKFGGAAQQRLVVGYSRSHRRVVAEVIAAVLSDQELGAKLRVVAEELRPGSAITLLRASLLDVALVHVDSKEFKDFQSIRFGDSFLEAVFHVSNRHATPSRVGAPTLRTVPLALLETGPTRRRINHFFGKTGPRDVIVESNSRTFLMDFIRHRKDAATILAGPLADDLGDELKSCALVGEERQVTKLLWLEERGLSTAGELFKAEVKKRLPPANDTPTQNT